MPIKKSELYSSLVALIKAIPLNRMDKEYLYYF